MYTHTHTYKQYLQYCDLLSSDP